MALAAHHHQQHQHQPQQQPSLHPQPQQQHQPQHHQQPPPPSQQLSQIEEHQQRGVTITTLHHQHGSGTGSPHHHFNLGDLSSAMQLGAVTADGNFVTMGGVVVGRIQHSREELQQLGVIKVESPSNGATATAQREG
ncbi:hypothetical protein KR074_003939 [Drosophila pseudoananassae]|nr:hypothetical protein KR074_003939 [Drosophila pseudoananassae]